MSDRTPEAIKRIDDAISQMEQAREASCTALIELQRKYDALVNKLRELLDVEDGTFRNQLRAIIEQEKGDE